MLPKPEPDEPASSAPRIQIVVTRPDHSIHYYPVPRDQGWRVDPVTRCIVIGRGVPRTYVPLDRADDFTVETY